MRSFLAFLAFVVAAAIPSQAQFGVYGGFTTSTLKLANTPRINGGTFGALYDSTRFPLANIGVDVRGTVLSSSTNNVTEKVNSVVAGPRVVFHVSHVPLRPYGELLIGEAHVTAGQGFASTDVGGLDASVAAGVDLHILPFTDWRVIDYSFSRLNAAHTYEHSFTTGIVIRFN